MTREETCRACEHFRRVPEEIADRCRDRLELGEDWCELVRCCGDPDCPSPLEFARRRRSPFGVCPRGKWADAESPGRTADSDGASTARAAVVPEAVRRMAHRSRACAGVAPGVPSCDAFGCAGLTECATWSCGDQVGASLVALIRDPAARCPRGRWSD